MSAQSVIDSAGRNSANLTKKAQGSFMGPTTQSKLNENKFGNLSQSVMLGSGAPGLQRPISGPLLGSGSNLQSKVKPSKDIREAECFDELPLQYTVKQKEAFHNNPNCELCDKKFTMMFRSHHCRMCAKTVCNHCCLERRLSQEDASVYFCCNECDFELTQQHAKNAVKQMQESRDQMLEAVRYCLMQADAGLAEMKRSLKEKRENLELERQAFEARKKE